MDIYNNFLFRKIPILRGFSKKKRYVSFYSQFINKNDLCFDVGANIGINTEAFLKIGARVIAIEPQEGCVRELNIKFQNDNVIIVPVALGDSSREGKIMLCDKSEVSSLSDAFINYYKTHSNLKWDDSQKIQITTLDILMEKYGIPKFCKIDVEGSEIEVFKGLSIPIKYISFEFNAPFKGNAIECIKLLGRHGKPRFNYSLYENMRLALDEWIDAENMINTLTLFSPEILTGDIYVEF